MKDDIKQSIKEHAVDCVRFVKSNINSDDFERFLKAVSVANKDRENFLSTVADIFGAYSSCRIQLLQRVSVFIVHQTDVDVKTRRTDEWQAIDGLMMLKRAR